MPAEERLRRLAADLRMTDADLESKPIKKRCVSAPEPARALSTREPAQRGVRDAHAAPEPQSSAGDAQIAVKTLLGAAAAGGLERAATSSLSPPRGRVAQEWPAYSPDRSPMDSVQAPL